MRRPGRSRWLGAHSSRLVASVLVAAGVLPPLGLAALPGGLTMLGAPRTGIVLVTALLFAPALVGFAVALQGFDAVLARLRADPGGEYRLIVGRVLLGALVIAYVFGLLAGRPGDGAVAPCLLIAALGLAASWQFLLHLILDPRPSAVRRYVAIAADIGVLSALLYTGGGLTAALCPIYPYIAISNGHHHGTRTLIWSTLAGAVGFAVAAAATPFWQEQPLLAGGVFVALVLLPAYVGWLLRGLNDARLEAEAANTAKGQFLTALSDDLRAPLRQIARAGAAIDRDTLTTEQWDAIARMRLSARAMLLQLDDVLNYVRIEAGDLAPETRSFDLYRLANGAVAALRAQAAERGIVLALRIDPHVPYQLRGWPHQLRQILICLITNAVRHSGKAKLRINVDAAELDADRVTLRVAVASGVLDTPTEPHDEPAEPADDVEAGRLFGLAMVDRLVGLMGGRLDIDTDRRRGLLLAVELPLEVDQASLALPLDLAHLPVLLVTKDAQFVGDLIEPFEAWRADARWIGAGDAALAYLDALDPRGRRPVLVVDGRGDVLQALSWAHAAVSLHAPLPPYVLFIADEARIDSVIGLADGDLDGILPAPFTPSTLRSAVHALRVEPADWFLSDPAPPLPEEPPPPFRRSARIEVAPLEPGPPRPPPANPPPPHGLQILVAASTPANGKIMEFILGRVGHAVQVVESIDEARQGLEVREIDVLLLDLVATAGDDYAAALLCRRARPTLPIIALTGDSTADAERLAREGGFDAVLPKPVEPSRLIAAIEAAVGGMPPAASAPVAAIVTEIASHPRFAAEAQALVDQHAVEALWSLGDGPEFFQDMIEAFRADSQQVLGDMGRAVAAGDTHGFDEGIQALRHCTANFGGGRLRDLLMSLRGIDAAELRRHGAAHVQRLGVELGQLDAMLVDYLRTAK